MRRVTWIVVSTVVGPSAMAQTPASQPPTIVPVAASSPVHPLARFSDVAKYPTETQALVDTYRAATGWLLKTHQAHGRFLPGLDPALASKIESDSDAHQAVACLALCQAARLNPDPGTTAKASQAVLALLATKKIREPGPAAEKVVYAAAVSLAVRELPTADAKLAAAAEQLVGYLRSCASADGTFPIDPAFPGSGLAVQAVAASAKATPDPWKAEFLIKSSAGYRSVFQAKPNAVEAATVVAGLAEAAVALKDVSVAATAFELADAVCAAQYGPADAGIPAKWVGGFRGPAEPGYEAALVARGLAAATKLTRQTSTDLARYAKYRSATLNTLAFVQGLQATDETTSHFDSPFRTRFLVGGVRVGLSNGILRPDATGWAAMAVAAFLESGAEGRE